MMQSCLRTARRSIAVLTVAAMSVMLLPGIAHAAGTVTRSGSTLTYTGGWEASSLTIGWDGTNVEFSDLSTTISGAPCNINGGDFWGGGGNFADCPAAGITAVVVRTAGGDDTVQVDSFPSNRRLTVYLGDGRDSYTGGRTIRDIVRGGAGNDSIDGRGGNDALYGDGGSDRIDGDGGNDTISGGFGADKLFGRTGNDVISGGAGNDQLEGNPGGDRLNGGPGADHLSGGLGADNINGAGGNDRLLDDHRGVDRSFLSPDTLVGGRGRDTVDYSYRRGEATRLRLSIDGRRNDGARGEGDLIAGSVENIIGGLLNDRIIGSKKPNSLAGRGGDDVIYGRGGNDRLFGESGHDGLSGGPGSDLLDGWFGRDTLVGGGAADVLRGGADNDDLISRDRYRDSVQCGSGVDRAAVDGRDRVSSLCNLVFR